VLLIGGEIRDGAVASDLAYHRWKLHHAIQPIYIQALDGPKPAGPVPGTDSPLVGKPAPDFELDLLDGKKFRLTNSRGRVVVLDFWATWCGPCLQSMPQVERAVRELRDSRVELIAVNLEEPPNLVAPTLERHQLKLTVALDRDGVVAAKYEATAIPQTVVIDREGKVARLFVGGGPQLADQLRDAVRDLLPVQE
jgi:thiol-disulfide isomerase/thioredoxin